ncbi:MAG TPA: ferritin-like domain-containing protein [Longimicrobium sp.]|nr:ferritin-like domain-containing protein [Longimicrobium sp.]
MAARSEATPAEELKEVLVHELGDLLYAERRTLTMLKTLVREAADPVVIARMEEHRGETEEQIERLERAFASIGEKAKAEKCEGIVGLKEEHDAYKRDEKPSKPQLAAFDLGSGLRVEHYEIAAYRTAIAMATVLGQAECVRLLQESLMEEEDMARFLEKNAVKSLRKLLAQEQAKQAA